MTAARDGVLLAGGRGTRLPGKLTAELDGRPLLASSLAALTRAGLTAHVVAKARATDELRATAAAAGARWIEEPDEPTHPLLGIVTALELLRAPIVVCAADMPFVPAALLVRLASDPRAPDGAVVCTAAGRLQPLLARYAPALLPELRVALTRSAGVTAFLKGLDDTRLATIDADLGDWPRAELERAAFDVDTPADLEAARASLEPGGSSGAA